MAFHRKCCATRWLETHTVLPRVYRWTRGRVIEKKASGSSPTGRGYDRYPSVENMLHYEPNVQVQSTVVHRPDESMHVLTCTEYSHPCRRAGTLSTLTLA